MIESKKRREFLLLLCCKLVVPLFFFSPMIVLLFGLRSHLPVPFLTSFCFWHTSRNQRELINPTKHKTNEHSRKVTFLSSTRDKIICRLVHLSHYYYGYYCRVLVFSTSKDDKNCDLVRCTSKTVCTFCKRDLLFPMVVVKQTTRTPPWPF